MTKIPIHLDCDTGQDDAIALLYALGSDNIYIKSISVVGGNVDVEQCAHNTLQILELAGRADIPVYIGADKPLKRALKSLPEVFGVTGMAGAEDMPSPVTQAIRDMYAMNDAMMTYPTLVATAPLTNIALNIQANPTFVKNIKHIIMMGGCVFPEPIHTRLGNFKADGATDYAEYNFAVDPEATQIVFASGVENITMIGLNVTRSVLYNHDIEKALLKCGNFCARRAAKILSAVGEEDLVDYASVKKDASDPVRALHDIVAMVAVDRPDIFTFEELPIRIRLDKAAGQTVIDRENPDHPRVRVATNVNKAAFYRTFIDTISRLP
jgi:inosine-uridine nucleoside N-ribohydrolase